MYHIAQAIGGPPLPDGLSHEGRDFLRLCFNRWGGPLSGHQNGVSTEMCYSMGCALQQSEHVSSRSAVVLQPRSEAIAKAGHAGIQLRFCRWARTAQVPCITVPFMRLPVALSVQQEPQDARHGRRAAGPRLSEASGGGGTAQPRQHRRQPRRPPGAGVYLLSTAPLLYGDAALRCGGIAA